jgi:hypothetical protein
MSVSSVLLLGMLGASAPEVVRLYSLRQRPPKTWSLFYLAISLLFAALGGTVAVLLPATTPWAAFYAGISTPTLVTTALRKASESRRTLRGSAPGVPPREAFGDRPSLINFLGGL